MMMIIFYSAVRGNAFQALAIGEVVAVIANLALIVVSRRDAIFLKDGRAASALNECVYFNAQLLVWRSSRGR